MAAILKKKLTKMFVKSGRYCRKKIVSKYENLIFISDVFLYGGHIGGHFEKKIDEDVYEVGQIL